MLSDEQARLGEKKTKGEAGRRKNGKEKWENTQEAELTSPKKVWSPVLCLCLLAAGDCIWTLFSPG